MVTTRAKRPEVASRAVTLLNSASNGHSASPSHEPLTPTVAVKESTGTIGSRLRKRRRTGSLPAENNSPKEPKSRRTNSRRNVSPYSRRTSTETKHTQAESFHQATQLRSRITANGNREVTKKFRADGAIRKDAKPTQHTDIEDNSDTISQASEPTPNSNEDAQHIRQAAQLVQAAEVRLPSSVREPAPPRQQQQLGSPGSPPSAEIQSIIDEIQRHRLGVDMLRSLEDEYNSVDIDNMDTAGASLALKTQSLPILDNLAIQILRVLSMSSLAELTTMITQPESEPGKAYATLKGLFDDSKKVYAMHDSFLNFADLGLPDNAAIETIRKANLATFMSSVFGSHEVGFHHLNHYFLDVFAADGNRLLKSQAALFLDLKTQAYISAMMICELPKAQVLEDLFPSNLEEQMLSRRPGAKQLAPSEEDFLLRARNRRGALADELGTREAAESLLLKYKWEDFLFNLSSYVSKNFASIAGETANSKANDAETSKEAAIDLDQSYEQHQQREQENHTRMKEVYQPHYHQLMQQRQYEYAMAQARKGQPPQQPLDPNDIAGKAAQAAQFAMQGFATPNGQPHGLPMLPHPAPPHFFQHYPGPPPYPGQLQHPGVPLPPHPGQPSVLGQAPHQTPHQLQFQFPHHQPQLHPHPPPGYYQPHPHMNGHLHPNMNLHQHLYADANGIPYPTQTAPTQVLYERARQAATAKSSPTSRRAGTPSQRRPWTSEEENALMAGLDRVKGPHWSQILAMFGPGGTINETLKDRNQVQLKDKARNLKLFFLKSGIEVPYYLQFVTGELKTRAPAQVVKDDTKRPGTGDTVSDVQAHLDAATALAGGLVQNGTNRVANTGGSASKPIGLDGAGDINIDDQTPIPSIGEHAVPSTRSQGLSATEQARRDDTIDADDDSGIANTNTKTHGNTHQGYGIGHHVSANAVADAAAEAAAEAAAAIALMGQARGAVFQ